MKTEMIEGLPTTSPTDVFSEIGKTEIIDVRRPDEFTGELGHISTAKLFTLGPDLEAFLNTRDRQTPLIFVCKSGGRSGRATEYCVEHGFKNVVNMQGGMLLWNQLKLATEK